MPKKISAPLVEKYTLEVTDPSKETYVTIKQARQEQQEIHDNLFSETTRIWNDQSTGGEMRLMQRVSVGEVVRTEVFLTMTDCNIIGPDDQPWFKFGPKGLDMDSNAFRAAWGQLDPAIVDEIHEKVRLMNPQWGPQGKAG